MRKKLLKVKNSIGTKKESSLHRELKNMYTGSHDRTEVRAGGYIADGINAGGEFIEIQTGSFAPLKRKLKTFARENKIRIVHPVAAVKYIEVFEPYNGTVFFSHRRKSPRKGSPWDLFYALVYAWELANVDGLVIEIVLADIVERRLSDGKGSWRRRGLSVLDRQLETPREKIAIEKKQDYCRFAPFEAREEFSTSMLAKKAKIHRNLAAKTLYVLTKLGIVKRVGKNGNCWVYKKTECHE